MQQLLPYLLSFLFSLFFISLSAQDCDTPDPANGRFLHTNNIKAYYIAAGSSFFDGNDAQYKIADPLVTDGSLATMFAHGLWMGGYDATGNLMVAASEYGLVNGWSDYYSGPLMDDGSVLNSTCANFSSVWSVYRYQIEAHQADFADNGLIDNPIDQVVGWPAQGNDQFESVNGFVLPASSQGYADFADLNTNGIYEPLQGEYPRISQTDLMPDQIIWTVFNTRGSFSRETGSALQLPIEVQLTAWAFNCTDNPILNYSTFASYKIINKSAESISDFRLGFWTDFDLGCYTDDYIGSAPLQNTYFAYNQSNNDNFGLDCPFSIVNAGENPPVQSVSFLNQSLDYFSYYSYISLSTLTPFGPDIASEYYAMLDGLFADGLPITPGGTGYNPGSTEEPVGHAFPGDPNDPAAWSAYSEVNTEGDPRVLGSTIVEELPAGGSYTIDLAYAYHREEGADHIGNVSSMYANVAAIQALYDNGFSAACTLPMACEDECVWPGDLNADGIANHEDLLALGFDINASGPSREGPYNWYPRAGESWQETQVFGADQKHLDANGDGIAEEDDFDLTVEHYNFTRPGYVPAIDNSEGDDLTLHRLPGMQNLLGLMPGSSYLVRIRLQTEIPDLRALAFSLEYDLTYLEGISPFSDGGISSLDFAYPYEIAGIGKMDYASYVFAEGEDIGGTILTGNLRVKADFPNPLPSDETFICFRNIRGYLSDGTEVEIGAQKVPVQIDGIIVVDTKEPSWAQSIQLYPNPVKDQLQLQSSDITIDQLQVFDSNGRAVTELLQNTNDLDTKQLPTGIYYLRIYSEGQFVIRKFVKMY